MKLCREQSLLFLRADVTLESPLILSPKIYRWSPFTLCTHVTCAPGSNPISVLVQWDWRKLSFLTSRQRDSGSEFVFSGKSNLHSTKISSTWLGPYRYHPNFCEVRQTNRAGPKDSCGLRIHLCRICLADTSSRPGNWMRLRRRHHVQCHLLSTHSAWYWFGCNTSHKTCWMGGHSSHLRRTNRQEFRNQFYQWTFWAQESAMLVMTKGESEIKPPRWPFSLIRSFFFTILARKMDRVMEKLSESNATVQAFRINDIQSSEVQNILDFVRDNYMHPTNFLLVCSLECMQEVLLQVTGFKSFRSVGSWNDTGVGFGFGKSSAFCVPRNNTRLQRKPSKEPLNERTTTLCLPVNDTGTKL